MPLGTSTATRRRAACRVCATVASSPAPVRRRTRHRSPVPPHRFLRCERRHRAPPAPRRPGGIRAVPRRGQGRHRHRPAALRQQAGHHVAIPPLLPGPANTSVRHGRTRQHRPGDGTAGILHQHRPGTPPAMAAASARPISSGVRSSGVAARRDDCICESSIPTVCHHHCAARPRRGTQKGNPDGRHRRSQYRADARGL